MLDRVLKLIVMTWEGEQKSFSANILNGLARLLYSFSDEIKDDIFKEKLGEVSIKELVRTAKDRRAGSLGYAETMLIFYTKKMKNPPAWSKLYTNKLKPGKKQKKTEDMIQDEAADSTEVSSEPADSVQSDNAAVADETAISYAVGI